MPNKNRTGNVMLAWSKFQNRVEERIDTQRELRKPEPCEGCAIRETCGLSFTAKRRGYCELDQ